MPSVRSAPLGATVVTLAALAAFLVPGRLPGRQASALGDATHPYVLSSPIFTPKTGTSFATLFTSIEDSSMSMLLRRYDAVGTLLTSQSIAIGAHGSLQASPAAHSGAPLHVEVWAPKPGLDMLVTYTDPASVARRIEPGDMFHPRSAGAAFVPVSPFRACDTRATGTSCPHGAVGAGNEIAVTLAGVGGVPSAGVSAVTLNLMAIGGAASSLLKVWPDGEGRPGSAAIVFDAGQTLMNMITVKLGTNGKVRVFNAAGAANVVMELAGYYA